ncbi:ATP-binding protein [Zoogloea sp. LCSB751]|uniref:sensor histidine kinase n=1 Tax=Zoogloea sp. LCSB751 TaxID=1965277 RepID=UPI0009A4BA6F|nr:ATP-binding protein [Zoogloea sp. LCSB751]
MRFSVDNVPRPVTIRSTLLKAFVVVALAPAILLAGLAFVKARQALQAEIEQSLASQAGAIAADLDKVLFERLQNAAIWSRLEVMQDLQVQDVDRRLSVFLARLQEGYGGVYWDLSALDTAGRIVASSRPAALGQVIKHDRSDRKVSLSGTPLALSLPALGAVGPAASLSIGAPILSRFDDAPLGELRLEFDWQQVDAMLDRAAGDGRTLAIIDGSGRLIAASRRLRDGLSADSGLASGWARIPTAAGAYVLDATPAYGATVAVGVGRAAAFGGFEGLGWRTLVIQPLDEALAPIHRMVAIALLLLGALVGATLLLAAWVSGAIARPIVALTEFTRRYRRDGRMAGAPPGGAGEVGELSTAFVEMVGHIDESQRNLVRASKLAMVGEMASVIAHEVRTPLGIIRSSAQMLRREPGLSPEGREMTGFIDSETERLNRLVSTMLDSARPRVPVFVPTDVHGLIRRCFALLAGQASKKQVVFAEVLDATDPVAELDAEQMSQVFLNLILNALQILPEGGTVKAFSVDLGDALEIGIGDDGPGIVPEERERIFEAFFFRREGGVGLGLAIVQQIVQAHGGTIVAGRSPLGGALFTLRLPRHAGPHSS